MMLNTESSVLSGHVYLVDDDEDIRDHLSRVLIHFGLTVESYADADSFLKNAIEVSPAVVLLDEVLPGKTGLELFKSIRSSGWQSPVIFMSGAAQTEKVIEVMKSGTADFLWKPFSMERLIDAIKDALEKDALSMKKRVNDMRVNRYWALLTDREKEVCKLMIGGHGNNEIAKILQIKPDTAKKHRAKVMEKMGTDSLPKVIELMRNFEGLGRWF